ncbi:hypothetical protein PIB30_080522 [Stylosanthes scabra]|uniref:Uncharacterized protein n=1 Tax=Stylosanthes scabra TaxID=79078 RepID=A0ABU6WPR1_9FABA|nr:hypothetical protein [Stylosanthes scabra]
MERRKPKRRNRAPRAGAPHRVITRSPGSHSDGFYPHRAAVRLTRATARSTVTFSVKANHAPARSPPHSQIWFGFLYDDTLFLKLRNSEPVAGAAAGRPSNGAVAGELKTCALVHGCL